MIKYQGNSTDSESLKIIRVDDLKKERQLLGANRDRHSDDNVETNVK